jgi:cytochrome c peroxidase
MLALLVASLLVGAAADAGDFTLRLPLGLQEQAAYVPDDDPLTAEKIALGKQLFWDTRWSRAMGRSLRELVNRLFSDVQQWAGTRASLEDQALKASDQSPELKNLGAIAEYQAAFRRRVRALARGTAWPRALRGQGSVRVLPRGLQLHRRELSQPRGRHGPPEPDLGRHTVTKREEHKGAFKTPTLRDVAPEVTSLPRLPQ